MHLEECMLGHGMEIINDTAIVTHTGNVNIYLRLITFKEGTEEELQFTKSMFTSKSLLLWRKAFVTKTLCTSCLRRQVPCCLRAAQPRSIGKKAPQVTKEYVLTRSQQRRVADMMSIQDQDLRNNDLVDKHSWNRTQRCIIIDCSNGFKAVLGNRLQYFAICFSAAAHSVISSNQLENGKLRLQELLSFSEADIPDMIHRGKVLYLFENEEWNLNNVNPSYWNTWCSIIKTCSATEAMLGEISRNATIGSKSCNASDLQRLLYESSVQQSMWVPNDVAFHTWKVESIMPDS